MKCYVYKGSRKDEHYLYLAERIEDENGPIVVPEAILKLLGDLEFVVEFELHADKTLAQADAVQVLHDINEQGFYLQMPKRDMLAEENQYFN